MPLLTPTRILRNLLILFIFIAGITLVMHTGNSKKEKVSLKDLLSKELTSDEKITESKFPEKEVDRDDFADENYINSFQKKQENKDNLIFPKVKSDVLKFSDFVKKSCEENLISGRIEKRPINSWEFLINHELKLVFCPIFKSASSTWIFYFLKMKGVRVHYLNVVKNGPNHYARDNYPRPSEEYLQRILNENYTSLLIIRDPFERLLSAYKDKIESTSDEYYKPLRCKISNGKRDATGNCRATFPEFVDFLISEEQEGRQPNEHWATYDKFCSPCQVRFDYVLKFEHLDVEESFFISQIPGLASVLKTNVELHSSKTNYEFILRVYFSQLSLKQFEALLRIYRSDFEIFGYDYVKYRNMLL